VSYNEILATAPAGSAGPVDVTVVSPGGVGVANSPADQFTYVGVPTVTSVSPDAGAVAGGPQVEIQGTNFYAGGADGVSDIGVKFGTSAVPFGEGNDLIDVVNATTIYVYAVPSPSGGSETVDVTVSDVGGMSATSSADQFTYYNAPTESSVSPNAGPAGQGASVTVVGTNLFDVQAVDLDTATVYSTGGNDYTQLSQFASLPASSFTPDGTSGTMGTVVLPAEPAATVVYVDVVTPGGGGLVQQFTGDDPPALQALSFTFDVVPEVDALVPDAGPIVGGTSVEVEGVGVNAGRKR